MNATAPTQELVLWTLREHESIIAEMGGEGGEARPEHIDLDTSVGLSLRYQLSVLFAVICDQRWTEEPAYSPAAFYDRRNGISDDVLRRMATPVRSLPTYRRKLVSA